MIHDQFRHFAHAAARATGAMWAFLGALVVVAVWIATGPIFGFSDTWQLVINTLTSVLAFLLIALLQNSERRYDDAVRLLNNLEGNISEIDMAIAIDV